MPKHTPVRAKLSSLTIPEPLGYESLRTTQAEFYRVMMHKTVPIITERALRAQIGSLVSYGRPVVAGSVGDEATPMPTVQELGLVPRAGFE